MQGMMPMRGAVPNNMGAARQMNPGQPVAGMQNYIQRPQGQVNLLSSFFILLILDGPAANWSAASSTTTKSAANAAVSDATDAAAKSTTEFQPTAEQRATAPSTHPEQQQKPTDESKSKLWESRILNSTCYLTLLLPIFFFRIVFFPPCAILSKKFYLRSKSFISKHSFSEFSKKCRNRMIASHSRILLCSSFTQLFSFWCLFYSLKGRYFVWR